MEADEHETMLNGHKRLLLAGLGLTEMKEMHDQVIIIAETEVNMS